MKHFGTNEMITERLILRPFVYEDDQAMFKNWASDDTVTKHLSWGSHRDISTTQMILKEWVSGYKEDIYHWAIVDKESNEAIGAITVVGMNENYKKAEIGYCLGSQYWNKGIMTEAFKTVIQYLFEIGFQRIEAVHHVENGASGKVMLKSGLSYEGKLKKYRPTNKGVLVDCDMYSIVR